MKTKRLDNDSPKHPQFFAHAKAGNTLAIVPSNDGGDLLKIGKRFLEAGLRGWIGHGSGDRGPEEFFVAVSERATAPFLRVFLRRVNSELRLPAILAEGFELSLIWALDANGAVLQHPFGLTSKMERSSSGAMVLSWEAAAPAQPTQTEWMKRLEAAYREIQGYTSFEIDKN